MAASIEQTPLLRSDANARDGAADSRASFLEPMLLIRRVEETLLDLFGRGLLNGTTHTSIGQEACAVGVIGALDRARDVVFSNHRCHGHFLAYGGTLDLLFGEVMGKSCGTCQGVGGSQHLHFRNFYSNGIQGGIVPTATGMALAEKRKGGDAIVAVFLGDGTLGEGAVYEAFNIASLWQLPVLFVIEANGFAQSTPTRLQLAGNIVDRPRAFGIATEELGVRRPDHVHRLAAGLVGEVRRKRQPRCLVLHTYRLGPHSKGDDTRSEEELSAARAQDPLTCMLDELPASLVGEAAARVEASIEASLARCSDSETIAPDTFGRIARSSR